MLIEASTSILLLIMTSRRLGLCLFLIAGGLAVPFRAGAVPVAPVPILLWQEETYWDGLMNEHVHSRAARMSADPNLIPVLETITQQVAQQVLNLQQVTAYTKIQQDNLQLAFAESDPSTSLTIIQENLDTLSEGTDRIQNNLRLLAVRCRTAASQVLPDPQLTKIVTILIQQIQIAQIQLKTLYADATAVQVAIDAKARPRQNFLRYRANLLVNSIYDTQNPISAVTNASYEIYLRSKE